MSEFRGSFFRQSQTELCNCTPEAPRKILDEHNPPGSMFRAQQTLHIYGTLRSPYTHPELEPSPTPTVVSPSPTRQIETPEETTAAPTYQASEFLSFDLTHLTSRRLCLMAATRLLDHAAQLGNTDGVRDKDLRPYATNVHNATKRFERTIKPKTPLAFLREKLFED